MVNKLDFYGTAQKMKFSIKDYFNMTQFGYSYWRYP